MSRDPAAIALNAARIGSPAPEAWISMHATCAAHNAGTGASLEQRESGDRQTSCRSAGQPRRQRLRVFASSRDGPLQRHAVPFCIKMRRSKGPEGVQGIVQYRPRILNAHIALAFRTQEGLADDPVVGRNHGICDSAAPLHGTGGEDGETAITGNVAQPVGEVALPLSAKTGNAMRRNGLPQIGGKIEALREFQAIEKVVDVTRVPAHLELAQPDEPAHTAIGFLGEQPVETHAHGIVQA